MSALTYGFVGRTAAGDDGRGCSVLARHAVEGESLAALDRTALEVLAKHSSDPPGLYQMPLDGGRRAVMTLVRVPLEPAPVSNPLEDATPLPSALSVSATEAPPPSTPALPPRRPRVVFGAIVSHPDRGGPAPQDAALWLESLAESFERKHGLRRAPPDPAPPAYALFAKRIRASAPNLRPATSGPGGTAAAMRDVQDKMREVRLKMVDNIARVVDRGEKLDDVLAKSDGLRTTAGAFRRTAARIRSRAWWANVRLTCAMFGVGVIVVVIVFFIACKGVSCVA